MTTPDSPKTVPPRLLLERLYALYPDPQCELDFRSPFELLVATILSAQCTDVRVNMVTRTLFEKYRRPEDYLAVPAEELEEDIRTTGFFRNKAKNIRGACRRLLEAYGGEVPRTMEELLTLPGVARKTANVVLGNGFGLADGIAVDTHVTRLSGLLGLTQHTDPVKIERDLMAAFPREEWTNVSHLLILHGRRVCAARRPNCAGCALADLCPSAFNAGRAAGKREQPGSAADV
ncbi:MAG TPA: endonuclease III [Armatimonadota bacterium]|nr:endonuclease III [Armatimonadota bacterium]